MAAANSKRHIFLKKDIFFEDKFFWDRLLLSIIFVLVGWFKVKELVLS